MLHLVSIVTVVYNGEKQIESTIQSVLSQTYKNIEYIVIDGGSNDNTSAVIRNYQNDIAYWLSESDSGIANAWNKGLAKCSGEIIGILNAGDQYHPDTVRLIVEGFQNNQNAGFVFGDILMCDEEGKEQYKILGNPKYLESIDYEMSFIPHPSVFVKKSIYEKEGHYNECYRMAMDYDFLLRISKHGVIGYYLPYVLTTVSLGGVSDRKYRECNKEMMRISVQHGYSRQCAWIRYIYKSAKTFFRKNSEKFGLNPLIRFVRNRISRHYRYSG